MPPGSGGDFLVRLQLDLTQPIAALTQFQARIRTAMAEALAVPTTPGGNGPLEQAQRVGATAGIGYESTAQARAAGLISESDARSRNATITAERTAALKSIRDANALGTQGYEQLKQAAVGAARTVRQGGEVLGLRMVTAAEALTGVGPAGRRLTAAELEVAERLYLQAAAITQNTAATSANTTATQAAPKGAFGKFYQYTHPNSEQQPSPGQFFGSTLLRSAGYAASAAVLYGGISALRNAIKDSSELEKILNIIKSQFEGLGQGDQTAGFVANIKEISRETGQASTDVAQIAFQFVGAFNDIERAVTETRAASELSRITGLPLSEITDSLTALTRSFKDTGLSISDVGDTALGLQEDLGVLANQTITFAADLAPVARSVGFTADQLEILGAVTQKYSGRSGASLAEAFGRILPEVSTKAVDLIQFYRSIPDIANLAPQLTEALGAGDISEVFDVIGSNYDRLTDKQKTYIETLLGGRREAQTLLALFRNYNDVLKSNERVTEFAGKQAEYFNALQNTLAQRTARLGQEFRLLGLAIVQSGIGDFLKILLTLGSEIVQIFGKVSQVFVEFSDSLGGIPAKIAGITLAIIALRVALTALMTSKAGGFILARGAGLAGALGTTVQSVGAGVAAGGIRGGIAGLGAAGGVAGIGSAALGAVGGPIGIAAIGAFVGYQIVEHFSKGMKEAAQARVKALAGSDNIFQDFELNEVRARANQSPSTVARFANAFGLGGLSNQNNDINAARGTLGSELGPRYAQQIEDLLAEFPDTFDPENFKKTIELLRQGSGSEVQFIESWIEGMSAVNPEVAAFLDDWVSKDEKAQELGEQQSEILSNLDAAKTAYDAGQISFSQYMNAVHSEVEILRGLGLDDPARFEQFTQDNAEIANRTAELYDRQLSRNSQLSSAFGFGAPAQEFAGLKEQYDQLKNMPGVNPEILAEVRLRIFQTLKEMLDEEIAQANTAVEKAAIRARGINIEEYFAGGRFDELVYEIRQGNASFQIYLARQADAFLEHDNKVLNDTAKIMAAFGTGFQETFIAVLEKRIKTYENMLNVADFYLDPRKAADIAEQLLGTRGALEDFRESLPGKDIGLLPENILGKGDQVAPPDDSAQKEAEALAKRVADAKKKYAEALVKNNPVALAQLHQQQADQAFKEAKDEAEKINAQTDRLAADEELKNAIVGIYNAYTDSAIAAARRGEDFVKAAELEIEKAQLALDLAKDSGNAQLIIQASNDLEEKMDELRLAQIRQINETLEAQSQLSLAIAEAAGDTVAAAGIGLQEANRVLTQAQQEHGATSNEAIIAQAQAVRAAASVRDAQLSEDQENIQFALDMEEITKDQALEQFKTLLQLPGLTAAQTRDLRRKIKSLQDDTTSDLQLDLPTDIRLPTLYQVARYNTGYADNRVIQFNVQVNNGVDAGNLIDQINGVVNSPPRVGTTAPVY